MVWFGWTSTRFNEAGRQLTNLYFVTGAYQMHLCGSFDLSDTITSCYQGKEDISVENGSTQLSNAKQ